MIIPVSFTSNYSTSTKAPKTKYISKKAAKREENFRKFQKAANSLESGLHQVKIKSNYKSVDKYPYFHEGEIAFNVPNDMDSIVEGYLNYHKISYKKSND